MKIPQKKIHTISVIMVMGKLISLIIKGWDRISISRVDRLLASIKTLKI